MQQGGLGSAVLADEPGDPAWRASTAGGRCVMHTRQGSAAIGHGCEPRSATMPGTSGRRMIFALVIMGDASHPDG